MSATDLLVEGAKIHLWSKKAGHCLRIGDDGAVTASGRNGSFATFIVRVQDGESIKLQNEKHSNHWLAIKNDSVVGNATGGPYCEFQAIDHGPGFISLESMQFRGQYVGVQRSGEAEIKKKINDHTKFWVIINEPGDQTVPKGSRLLSDGARVKLWSFAYGKNVRITEDGQVDGKGLFGELAMFTVDTRGKGVVAFQNVQHPNHWITIKNDETTGTGTGGPFTEFTVLDSENGMVCLESVKHPGQHLGIVDDGSLKPPGSTGKGKHGRFHVILC